MAHIFGIAPRRRGSVLILVVALLCLLAVMGTVYIVSARQHHESSGNFSTALNLNLAQEAVNNQVRRTISNSMYDAAGLLGGYNFKGPFGTHAALRHDMPEHGILNGLGFSNQNPLMPDNTWLVQNLYRDGFSLDPRYNDFSLLTPCAFNPSIGAYDSTHPYYDPVTYQPAMPTFKVVSEDASPDDAFVQLLPFSEASGIRYRYGVRILDTNRMANLRIGVAMNSTLGVDAYGTFSNNFALGHLEAMLVPDNAASLDVARQQSPFDLSDELELRSYGTHGTAYTPRIASSDPRFPSWVNTLGVTAPPGSEHVVGNPRRGFYTTFSSSRYLRPYPLGDDAGEYRAYTLTPENQPSQHFWPSFPATVGLTLGGLSSEAINTATAMEKIAGYSHEETVAFTTNCIANSVNRWWWPNMPAEKTVLTSVWRLGTSVTIDEQGICITEVGAENPLDPYPIMLLDWLPVPYGGPGTMDIKAEPGRLYMDYTAQPFINEVAVRQKSADQATPDDDFAVELYNPYDLPLSLRGYWLYLAPGKLLDLSGGGRREGTWAVPARGYFVITRKDDELAGKVAAGATKVVVPGLDLSASHGIYLMREYIKRGGGENQFSFAAVDEYDISNLIDIPPGGDRSDGNHFMRRGNDDPPNQILADYLPRWCAAVYDPAVAEVVHDEPKKPGSGAAEYMTLGSANPKPPKDRTFAMPLYDRWLTRVAPWFDRRGFALPISGKVEPYYNVNEFDHIPRIAHEVDALTGLPAGAGTVSRQLAAIFTETPPPPDLAKVQFPREARVYFDFRTPPWVYSSGRSAGPDAAPIPENPPYPPGDLRAMRLLECLSFVDSGKDSSVPGQVNVNTAPAEVLSMIPILNDRAGWVSAILAYRWRTTSDDPRIPFGYRSTYYDFRDSVGPSAKYPGYGIRSLGELEIPLSFPFATAPNLDQREALWSDVFNLCTVRSDKFVLYGCLEAVKQNPRYRGPFDNFMDWYQTDPRYITDDPSNTTAPLLRVGRRRWIALLDTSSNASRILLSNRALDPNFALPKIIAAKDLPH